MGVVYRSTHPRLDIPVAIKVLAEQYSSDTSFRQRFHREAATVAALNHPGIVRVYDFDEDGPVLFIVMEWVEGRSMRSWLDEYGRCSVDVSFDRLQPSTAIPSPIMEIIWRATAKDRAARFQSCEEFAGAFHYMPKPAAAQPPMEAVSNEVEMVEQVEHRVAIPADARGSKPPGVCLHTDCTERRGWACAYKDLMGRECKSWWCRRHITFIERTPFCPRHASVIRALAPTAGTIFEIKNRPAVDDRALPLAALVAEDIDKDVTELVRRRYQNRKDVVLATDKTVRQTWAGRTEVAWERSWAALKSQGYLIRIAIRVSVAEPDHVQLLIGNTVVFKEVPDWIHRRREGEPPDHADRARFAKKVFAAVLEHVDEPTPLPPITSGGGGGPQIEPPPPPEINRTLIEGMVLRLASAATRMTGYEVADQLALPFVAVEPVLKSLTTDNFLDALGLASEQGPWMQRPLPERMAYALTRQGRTRSEEIARASTRYAGPAPVSMSEYRTVLAEAAKPGTLDMVKVNIALAGIELAPGVAEAVRAAVNSRSSIFIYGAPGNGKTTLARRISALLGGPIIIPVALDIGGGEVMTVFDGSLHRLEPRRAAGRGLFAAPVVQGPDARPDRGYVVPHLRARARAPDDPAEPGRGGLDPQHVRRPASARQPPARPARAAGRRVVSAGSTRGAQPGARPGSLADTVHRGLASGSGFPLVCIQTSLSTACETRVCIQTRVIGRAPGRPYTFRSFPTRRWRNGRRASFRS